MSATDIMVRTPDLVPGTLDAADPAHAAEGRPRLAISERIQAISEDVLQINQGSLYPALHRLELQGWLGAE